MPWNLTGNSGTTAADFVSTTDNSPLVIKANKLEAMRVEPNGNVGVGTNNPLHMLQIGGGFDGNLGLDGSDGSPNAGYIRFGDHTGWKFYITRQREYSAGPMNTGPTGALLTIQDNGDITVLGSLNVGGDIVMPASDFAEDFDIETSAAVEPGTVMVLDENGRLQPCGKAYDKKVAGVISGAGSYKTGLILDRQTSSLGRLPLALVGKVYCKADATCDPIEIGDLLTTSPTTGHAMKATDPVRAFGSVIGKALRPLASGLGLIPILVALQ